MKKAFAWSMLLMTITLFTVAIAPAEAHITKKDLYAASPHPYTPKWNPMLVGWVTVWNNETHLYVKYNTTGGWELTETHLAVVNDTALFPMTRKGNPKVGHFPYQMMHEPPVTEYTYVIPLDGWAVGTRLYVAAHAVVVMRSDGCVLQEETAWGDCGGAEAQFPGNNWATYFSYWVQ